MVHFKKFVFLFLVLTLPLSLTGCDNSSKNNDLEVAVKPDADIVFAFDHTDSGQMRNLQNLLRKFPETGVMEKINESVTDFDVQKDLLPILKEEWRAVFVVNFTKSFLSAPEGDPEAIPDVYLVAEFKEIRAVEKLLNDWFDRQPEEKDDVKLWNAEGSQTVAMVYGDVLIIADNEDSADRALGLLRAEEVELPDFVDEMNELSEERLGYVYVNNQFLQDVLESESSNEQADLVRDLVSSMNNSSTIFRAEDDGLRLFSATHVENEEMLQNVYLKSFGDGSDLLEKVNSEGLMAYSFGEGFGNFMDNFWKGFAVDFNESISEGYEPIDDNAESPDVSEVLLRRALEEEPPTQFNEEGYQEFLLELAGNSDLTIEDVQEILNSPFAFVVSDVGAMLPTMSLYLDLDQEYVDKAKEITSGLDAYMDRVIEKLDAEQPGVLKKEVDVVNGGGLHKLYVDWDAMEADVKSGIAFVPGRKVVEFYYGVTGDGNMVMALYPDFPAAYGKSSVLDNEQYLEAVEYLEDLKIDSYVNFVSVMDFVSKYWALAQVASGMGGAEEDPDFQIVDTILSEFLPTFKFAVSGSSYEDEMLRVESFIKVERIDK